MRAVQKRALARGAAVLALTLVATTVSAGDEPVSAASATSATSAPRPAPSSPSSRCRGHHRVSAWYAAPGDAALSQPPTEQTLRVQVRPLYRGRRPRLRLSNRFGSGPVTFGSVTIGKQSRRDPAALAPGSVRTVRFHGRTSVTVPAGKDVVSDRVPLRFRAFRRLLVSIYVQGSPGPATQHAISEQTTYQSAPGSGDHTRQVDSTGFVGLPVPGVEPALPQAIPYLTQVSVRAPRRVGTVATFGDSITDGTEAEGVPFQLSTDNVDKFASYPDQLATRLRRARLPLSVANTAISGNMLLHDAVVPVFGPSGLSRFGYDTLRRPGLSTVILLEGINDIGMTVATKDALVAGYRRIVRAAHARHVRVLIGTLTPQNGTVQPPAYGLLGEPTRLAVNRWIRHQHAADGIVDFDRAVRDPADPSRIRAPYDGGDHLHFSAAGYRAMARAVPLRQLLPGRCR